jgi:hypothetical protein
MSTDFEVGWSHVCINEQVVGSKVSKNYYHWTVQDLPQYKRAYGV